MVGQLQLGLEVPSRAARLPVAAEGPVEEPIHHGVEQERVYFVTTGEKVVRDAHQILDKRGNLLEAETDGSSGTCHGQTNLRVGTKALDVFLSERSDSGPQLNREQVSTSNLSDELLRSHARQSQSVGWRQKPVRHNISTGNRPPARPHHIRLTDVTDEFTDLPR
ncbi:MAG: hypothetical protein ACR2MO_08005 [Acidimicrobiales bacterium]